MIKVWEFHAGIDPWTTAEETLVQKLQERKTTRSI
jgi:hypothetical protein